MKNQKSNLVDNISKSCSESSFKKRKHTQLEKDIIKLHYLAKLKMKKKCNSTKKIYQKSIVDNLLSNAGFHLVSIFKENMLTDYIDEFLRRQYKLSESNERIPKFAQYYRNYLQFFCQPIFANFQINVIINEYGERRAELYYKNNYQGGKTNDNEDYGFEESDSEEESEKEEKVQFNEKGEIFNESIRDNIDNVTIMSTVNNSKNNTINLNLNNEKIEVFSENKCDVSNDTTLHDIMDVVKKGKSIRVSKKSENKIKNPIRSNSNDYKSNNNHGHSNGNNISNHNNTNGNRSKKGSRINKNKILSIIDFNKALITKDVNQKNQSKKKDGSKSVKRQGEKNNMTNLIYKENKKFLIQKSLKLLKKGGINKKYSKLQTNNFIGNTIQKNILNNINKIKFITSSNLKVTQENQNKEKEQLKNDNKDNQKKIDNQSLHLNIKSKSLSKEKETKKKIITSTSKNNEFYSIKNSYGDLNSNIFQNNFIKTNYINQNKYTNIYTTNKNNSRSRNNVGFLYKQQSKTNKTINNNIMYNLNNIYNATSLQKFYKNTNKNNNINVNNGKMYPFKTLNFIGNSNYHQRYNNNLLLTNNGKKYQLSNTSQDNKSSSLKIFFTDLNNTNNSKPTIQMQHDKVLIKSKHTNNNEDNVLENRTTNTHITKSYNNLNNVYLGSNVINSYNNIKFKNIQINNNNYNQYYKNSLKEVKSTKKIAKPSNIDKKINPNNKELMKFALSLLIENNDTIGNIGVNIHNNNQNNKKNNNSLNNKQIATNKNKTNYKSYSKYHNNNTNYNININNQININTGYNTNNTKKGKDYLNTKIKNQEKLIKNNYLNYNSNSINSGLFGITNSKQNSENIYLNSKIKIKNVSSGLKKWNLINNKKNNNGKRNENVIKSYHTKSLSSLNDIVNKNKQMSGTYKNHSKSRSKDYKKNYQ